MSILGLLYLFLLLVILAGGRELRAASASRRARAELEIVDPARTRLRSGERMRVTSGAVVGREPSSTVRLDEASVSAQHARLRFEDGTWWLEDLESTNGTFINDNQVRGRVTVRTGDHVRFGRVAVRFRT